MITQKELKDLVTYNPATGEMFWLPRSREMFKAESRFKMWNTRFANKECGWVSHNGYRKVYYDHKTYYYHRLIWIYVFGNPAKNSIDHINGNPSDNRIDNLRSVTHQNNCKNMKKPSDNTSGFIGVSWCKSMSKWKAAININKKFVVLGYYTKINEAAKVRKQAEIEHGYHENHGR